MSLYNMRVPEFSDEELLVIRALLNVSHQAIQDEECPNVVAHELSEHMEDISLSDFYHHTESAFDKIQEVINEE